MLLFFCSSCSDGELFDGALLTSDAPNAVPVDPCPGPASDAPVLINEVMLVNDSILQDEEGEFPPAWLELHNRGTETVEVGGATLTVGSETWEIPCIESTVLAPDAYLVIFLDGDDDEANPDDLHSSIIPPLSGSVTFIFTSDVVTVTADEFESDVSGGRFPDSTAGFELLLTPTPGAANSEFLVPPEDVFVRGDVNEDAEVTLSDADLLLMILFSEDQYPSCVDRLDVNDDGIVDVADVSFLYMAVAPGGPLIPAPFPNPDIDFTLDDLPCVVDIGGN